MWQSLFANLAVAATVLTAWTAIGDTVARLNPLPRQLLFGAVMAVGTLGSMAMAFQPIPGVYFDFRGPLILLTCLFGGLPAAIVATVPALLYRIAMGGQITMGVLAMLTAVSIGLVGTWLRGQRQVRFTDLVWLASASGSISALFAFALSSRLSIDVSALGAPVVLSFFATLLFGAPLLQEQRRRALFVNNRFYRSMVDALPDCLNIKDLNGRFLAANPATATLMRAPSSDALIGKSDFDFYPTALAEKFRLDELAVLRDRQHVTIEQAGLRPDGSAGWLSTLKAPLRDETGQIAGLITHNRDVTDRVELQAKLVATQAILDRALDNMTDGLAMYDENGFVLFCNGRYRELSPKTAHLRVPGTNFAAIIREMIRLGEEKLAPGEGVEEHVALKCAELRRGGEDLIEFADGRVFAATTKLLPDGNTLRTMSDVTARRSFEKNLEYMALHDPLTGLPNRALFNRELAAMLERARSEDCELAVMLLDLDRFKSVNDNFGHAVGDALLVEVARRIEAATRRGDVAARLGGDEFAILMTGPRDSNGAPSLARRILKNIAMPLTIDNVALLPSGTVGYTLFPADDSDAEGLLRNADRALYRGKAAGRGTWRAFDPADFAPRAALAG